MKQSHNDTRSAGALRRLPGEKWADFQARQQAAMKEAQTTAQGRRYPRSVREAYERKRNADHVDGFDRDDLGLSPDY